MSDPVWYRQQKGWQIRGRSANGGKLAFTVMAYDHAEAEKKAKVKVRGGQITDVVLLVPKTKLI